ncbi:hypothetical protein XpopCFBP1817_20455 [Xanthomonas populi]|uniref:Uncharacterized protein n=1 Tax=Xanthomonas populi TaxID=53414 RepID=A0A2S7E1Y8_9XANT|nr:hypothetical protein XpopCFBP1817_20455 [Xanthomonas populi]
MEEVLLNLLDPIRRGIGGRSGPFTRTCPLTQFRQRVLAVLGAARIDGVGDFLIGRAGIGYGVVDQVTGDAC